MVEVPDSEAVIARRRAQHRARNVIAGVAMIAALGGGTAAAIGAAHTGNHSHPAVQVQPKVEKPTLEFRPVLATLSIPKPGECDGGRALTPADRAGPEVPQVVLADAQHKACYVLGPTVLTGANIDKALPGVDRTTGSWVVNVHFKNHDFVTKVAQPYLGKQVAIAFDGTVLSAPVINNGITTDDVTIAGPFTQQQAQKLAAALLGVPVSQVTIPPDEPSSTTTVQIVSPPVTPGTTVAVGNRHTVTVPDLVLAYPPDALNMLHSLGLTTLTANLCVPRFQNDVQRTDPPAGTQVPVGSTVTVYVGVVCDPNSTVPAPTSTTAGT